MFESKKLSQKSKSRIFRHGFEDNKRELPITFHGFENKERESPIVIKPLISLYYNLNDNYGGVNESVGKDRYSSMIHEIDDTNNALEISYFPGGILVDEYLTSVKTNLNYDSEDVNKTVGEYGYRSKIRKMDSSPIV